MHACELHHMHILFIFVLIAAIERARSVMSPKGAKYRTSHAYGKRRKAWIKKRKQHTEMNAADLGEQDKPVHVEDRERSPAGCDSTPACAGYDPATGCVDGACGVEDASASSAYDVSTRVVDQSWAHYQ